MQGHNNNRELKKDRNGKVTLKYTDDNSNQVYKIDAPNNVFFNDDLSL